MLPSPRQPGSMPRRLPRVLVSLAVVCGLLGAVALPLADLPVARWCRTKPLPKELMRLLDFSEIFAHGIGVASVLAALLVIDPSLRPRLRAERSRDSTVPSGNSTVPFVWWSPVAWLRQWGASDFGRILAAIVTGGLLVDLVKVSVVRIRPRALDLDAVASAWATFGAEALAKAPGARGTDLMSFPSGHSAVAAGLAAGLAWRYPHAWPAFATFAALAVLQRIFSSAHYPSDAACGAAIGLVGAAFWLGGRATSAPETPPTDTTDRQLDQPLGSQTGISAGRR
jgi:hypothetical protein